MKGWVERDLLDSRRGRLTAFGLLYVSEGIPYGFTSVALVAFMRMEDVSLERIGIVSAALFIPWSFKWAWAPVVDLVKLHRFGGRKAWILSCLAMMIITLVMAAMVDFSSQFGLLVAMVLFNNLFCATQDVAIDSLAVSTLHEDERGRGNGFMFGGQNVGIALGGGGAIFVYGLGGISLALLYVSVLQLICLAFVLFFVRDPFVLPHHRERAAAVWREIRRSVLQFLSEVHASFFRSGRGPKLGLLFSVLPVGAFALGYAALTTIQVDYGLAENEIARLSMLNTVAAAGGCVAGGLVADRFGIRRMLGIYYVLTALPGLVLAGQISSVGLTAIPSDVFEACLIAHGLIFGMAFGTHAAVFMGMTNPAVAATQFTAFMAMGNVAISYTNYWQGVVAERFDYSVVLYVDAALMLIPLAILPFIRSREEELQVGAQARV